MEPSSEELYGIGVITGEAPNIQVKILREIDGEAFQRYSEAVTNALAPLNRFDFSLVEKNFQTYLNVQKFAIRLMSLGRDLGGIPDRMRLAESVMTQIINWLTSFRLFLDHAETNLKRRYGEDSAQFIRFKKRTALAYDGTVGYRFIYKFRNYVQHCGAPISSFTLGSSVNEAGVERRTVSFRLDRQRLVRDFDWGSKVTPDLAAMGDTFDLDPLCQEAMEQLRGIDHLLLEMLLEEGARTISDVREALNLISGEEGMRNLFRFTVDVAPTILTLSPQPFPSEESVASYEALAAGIMRPEEMIDPPSPPLPPPFDPGTIAERFHRDSRAVQLMTLWQSEGGSTATFVQQVNAMILEDGGVEPILTGFFNMTAVLLHMTASALGVDPQGLIGGLLDIYPESG